MTRLFTVDSQLGILILMIADILVVTHQSINQSILVYWTSISWQWCNLNKLHGLGILWAGGCQWAFL